MAPSRLLEIDRPRGMRSIFRILTALVVLTLGVMLLYVGRFMTTLPSANRSGQDGQDRQVAAQMAQLQKQMAETTKLEGQLKAALEGFQSNSQLRLLMESLSSHSTDQLNSSAGGCNCTGAPEGVRPWAEGEERPLCVDGRSPGRWHNFSTWEPHNCRYREYTVAEVRQCLKGKWVHFYGDSLSRLMANGFSHKAGMNRRDWSWDKDRSTLMDTAADEGEVAVKARAGAVAGAAQKDKKGRRRLLSRTEQGLGPARRGLLQAKAKAGKAARSKSQRDPRGRPRITYLFRGKMAHQRHPGFNSTGEQDLNNHFLEALKEEEADQPDFLVMSIGAHEVIGWSGRPAVDLDLELFKQDTEELLQMLKESFTGGRLIWWKAHAIWPGKVTGEDYFLVQQFHEQFQEYAYRRFQEEGYLVADFYQTTANRPDLLYSKDGVHYGGAATDVHTRILINMMCNEQVTSKT